MEKHEFAIFVPDFAKLIKGKTPGALVATHNEVLYHRLINVLRLKAGETMIFFDQALHARVTLESTSGKKSVTIQLGLVTSNVSLDPAITVLLPILKREALEEAVYSCAELGANKIQLITTQKVQRAFGGEKEMQRLQNTIIAASEQSKHFSFPQILAPVVLASIVETGEPNALNISFDVQGRSFVDMVSVLEAQKPSSIVLLVGPEGDFTAQERLLLNDKNFRAVALTPTVLRAQQALVVGLGALRSIVS